ncbi:MAG: alpha/beta hydrolase [Rhodospirillaceae bacterium]|nr:alpha/beta hydrolase [Rhodospirillaceae bacterium]MDD9918700.1 alpha/beta hydrolase [Rhodospirillaceae bacterium]MDD9928964.1 alpha/beta hydrolase [Rhodospirillaceae bacterium]
MPKAATNGVELEYELTGPEDGPPLLLVGGLGVQIISWTETFVAALADRGFRVIAYDNRDIGLSTKHDDWGPADIKTAFKQARAKEKVEAPYTLEDMADDAAGLLEALGIDKAHIVGSSNGGAIAQTLAIRHPDKIATMVSIMATSGRRGLPRPEGEVAEWLARPRNPSGTREGAMDEAVSTSHLIGSPGFPRDEQVLRDRAGRLYDRSFYPAGNSRHLLASIASGDGRAARLGEITAPTLVIHGRDDPLVDLACAEDVQKTIPGAEMLVIDGMGHDYPDGAVPQIADAVLDNAKRANG